eukprot:1425405-Amphidinium_carterae.1
MGNCKQSCPTKPSIGPTMFWSVRFATDAAPLALPTAWHAHDHCLLQLGGGAEGMSQRCAVQRACKCDAFCDFFVQVT